MVDRIVIEVRVILVGSKLIYSIVFVLVCRSHEHQDRSRRPGGFVFRVIPILAFARLETDGESLVRERDFETRRF